MGRSCLPFRFTIYLMIRSRSGDWLLTASLKRDSKVWSSLLINPVGKRICKTGAIYGQKNNCLLKHQIEAKNWLSNWKITGKRANIYHKILVISSQILFLLIIGQFQDIDYQILILSYGKQKVSITSGSNYSDYRKLIFPGKNRDLLWFISDPSKEDGSAHWVFERYL